MLPCLFPFRLSPIPSKISLLRSNVPLRGSPIVLRCKGKNLFPNRQTFSQVFFAAFLLQRLPLESGCKSSALSDILQTFSDVFSDYFSFRLIFRSVETSPLFNQSRRRYHITDGKSQIEVSFGITIIIGKKTYCNKTKLSHQ